ncbi:TupA-like ATPgrasp, partial [Idiomarinaceae bacterium HL-53]
YFEYLSLTTFFLAEIKQKQAAIRERFSSKEPAWIIESFKQGTLPSAAVPFDYKFYVFQGQVGLIFQIDRNANPPRVAMFDGSFKPLTLGEDYKLREGSVQPATPIIPARAMEFVWWAQLLSRETDSPFVSVDLFDTTEGPVFGEYTFSPGAVQKHMFTLSDKFIEELDGYFLDAEKRIGSPGLPDLRNAREETAAVKLNIWALTAGLNKLKELQLIDKETFSRLANVAYMAAVKGHGAWQSTIKLMLN